MYSYEIHLERGCHTILMRIIGPFFIFFNIEVFTKIATSAVPGELILMFDPEFQKYGNINTIFPNILAPPPSQPTHKKCSFSNNVQA